MSPDIAFPLIYIGAVIGVVLVLYLFAKKGAKSLRKPIPSAQRKTGNSLGSTRDRPEASPPSDGVASSPARVAPLPAEQGVQVAFKTRSSIAYQYVEQQDEIDEPEEDDRDAWEGSFWEAQDVKEIRVTLRFNYTDSKGKETHRTAQIRQMGILADGPIIIGHCLLRDETRTFRPERMTWCVDADSGKFVDDEVEAYLLGKYADDPERLNERLRDDEVDTLKVLYYIGKADGQLREEEKKIIRATAKMLVDDSRLTDQMIDRVLIELGVPSLQGFKLAVGRLAKRGDAAMSAVMSAAEQMVATQKSVAPAEAEALAYLRKRFSPSSGSRSAEVPT